MIQIYFLSIFFNVLAGYALISTDENDALEIKPGFSLKDETVRLILGIISMITGVLKLLSPIEGNLLILGDLVTALAGLATGFILLFEYYINRSTIAHESGQKLSLITALMIGNKRIVGYIAITVAALHFLFPRLLFL